MIAEQERGGVHPGASFVEVRNNLSRLSYRRKGQREQRLHVFSLLQFMIFGIVSLLVSVARSSSSSSSSSSVRVVTPTRNNRGARAVLDSRRNFRSSAWIASTTTTTTLSSTTACRAAAFASLLISSHHQRYHSVPPWRGVNAARPLWNNSRRSTSSTLAFLRNQGGDSSISSSSFFGCHPSIRHHHRRTRSLDDNHQFGLAPTGSSTNFAQTAISKTTMSASTSPTTSDLDSLTTRNVQTMMPPHIKREEDRVIYAGIASSSSGSNSNLKDIPRQADHSTEPLLDPPVAVPDPYGWMRDETRTDPIVVDHLIAENAYTEAQTHHLESLRSTLYQEFLDSIQETDYTTPRAHGPYWYYTRTYQGKAYTAYCRAPKFDDERPWNASLWDGQTETPVLDNEQIMLDVNQLAINQSYCAVGAVEHSSSHQLLAYSVDYTGDEICQLHVINLSTGESIDHDPELKIDGSIEWGADDQTLFYLKLDDAHRSYQVYRRKLNKELANEPDELLLEELDDLFSMGMSKSLDGKYLLVHLESQETSEVYFLDLLNPNATLQCIAKRRFKVLYDIDHRNGSWWIQSNVGGLPNMALFSAPAVANCQDLWSLVTDPITQQPLFDGGYERSLSQICCFHHHVIATGREDGLPRIWLIRLRSSMDDSKSLDDSNQLPVITTSMERLDFPETAYDVHMMAHYEFRTNMALISYESMITPPQSLEIAVADTSQRRILKEKHVPGYDKMLYGCERRLVPSRDGMTEIPVTMVYRKDTMEQYLTTEQPLPVLLYGYGAYGHCLEADFRATRLALLNRGMVFIQAHVRGGSEMGRQWYEEPNGAKYLCKKNTFNDFVDVARWLINDHKITSTHLLACHGRSAGGLLIGASINQAPELFQCAIMDVPFVDVVPTMVDASIPLTAGEWEEWGNPNEIKYHQYMMDYSPVQNVRSNCTYPACLLTGGLHDPRVQYWEPAKMAATLRYRHDDDDDPTRLLSSRRPICLRIDMTAGHSGSSDRYKYLKELAFGYAFMLDQLGLVGGSVM